MERHCFVICAYKESPYLERCIRSLTNQTIHSKIILATSTPNEYIRFLCNEYKIEVFVNKGQRGITQDWNYAYSIADAQYVTLAHQDDVYGKKYVEVLLRYLGEAEKPIIFFSDYAEIRGDRIVDNNRLLRIKRLMMVPLRMKLLQNSRFVRRRILSLGNPICCPSVTFVKENCPRLPFQNDFWSDEDWQAWEVLSRRKGAFVYFPKVLLLHRIHNESETTKILANDARRKEDYVMFKRFWPSFIARVLVSLYGKSEKSNEL